MPNTLSDWVKDAKRHINSLPPPHKGLMARFLWLKIRWVRHCQISVGLALTPTLMP